MNWNLNVLYGYMLTNIHLCSQLCICSTAVYLPNQMSEYYHEEVFEYLSNDIILINAVYNVFIYIHLLLI